MPITFTCIKDQITPSLARLSDPSLISDATLAAGTTLAGIASQANSKPPHLVPLGRRRKRGLTSNPLLGNCTTLQSNVEMAMEGPDAMGMTVHPMDSFAHLPEYRQRMASQILSSFWSEYFQR